MYLVPVVPEDGPLGVMELEVLTPENTEGFDLDEVWTECGHKVHLGEVTGWWDDGYQSKSAFCHLCIIAVGEPESYAAFATEAKAWAFVKENSPEV